MANSLLANPLSRFKPFSSHAFTIVELLIVIAIIGVVSTLGVIGFNGVQKDARDKARDSQTTIIANALEKYYDDNNEYPSVALMTSQNVDLIKQKLKISDSTVLKFPQASTASSIATSNPSPTQLAYSANTSDSSKNTQCQTDLNGYCDGFVLQYKKEFDGTTAVAKSLHDTFTPVAGTASCAAGETQSGNTCTKTYAATYQSGTYTCPSGGTLSGTTCTSTYAASYQSGSSGYYYCPSGGTLSGSTCTTTTTYTATDTGGTYYCPAGTTGGSFPGQCSVDGTSPPQYVTESYTPAYTCPNGGSLSGSTCTKTSSYAASYQSGSSGYYYCTGGDTLNSSTNTCTHTYAATQSGGYYTCPSGGTPTGSTCTYTYTLP